MTNARMVTTLTALDTLNACRRAWEKTQPQLFLDVDALDDRIGADAASPAAVSPSGANPIRSSSASALPSLPVSHQSPGTSATNGGGRAPGRTTYDNGPGAAHSGASCLGAGQETS